MISNRVYRKAIANDLRSACLSLIGLLEDFDSSEPDAEQKAAVLLAAIDRLGLLATSLQYAIKADYGNITPDILAVRALIAEEFEEYKKRKKNDA